MIEEDVKLRGCEGVEKLVGEPLRLAPFVADENARPLGSDAASGQDIRDDFTD